MNVYVLTKRIIKASSGEYRLVDYNFVKYNGISKPSIFTSIIRFHLVNLFNYLTKSCFQKRPKEYKLNSDIWCQPNFDTSSQ